jgi:hypothetical protein
MRELVYLSTRKLNGFHQMGSSFTAATAEIGLQAPGVSARFGVAPATGEPQAERRKLEKVIRHIDKRAAPWTDPNLAPGSWVRFDLPMGFSVFSEFTGHHPVVLFAGTAELDGRELRLLLSGSPVHLLGADFPKDNYWASQGRYLDRLAVLIRDYDEIREDGDDDVRDRLADMQPTTGQELLHAYAAAARQSPQRARARLSGHARVLLRLPEHDLLAATPLYVQFGEALSEHPFLRRIRRAAR